MEDKKKTTLSGTLMRPLTVGECAFIRHASQTMRTSTVLKISSVSPQGIEFETRNTHYRLLPPAAARTATVERSVMAAA